MFICFLKGLLFGLAYVAPIGMQNLYVINTAIQRDKLHAYRTALVTTFFDISLALACFFGVGIFLESFPVIKNTVLIIGSAAVVYIGIGLIRSTPSASAEVKIADSLLKTISVCFAVTWLNPQAIIDGTLILGGIRASLSVHASGYFIAGVAAASFSWFIIISTIVNKFKNIFSGKVLRYINILCGSIIIFYGIQIGYGLIRQYFL